MDTLSIPAKALLGDIQSARGDSAQTLRKYRFITRLDATCISTWLASADIMLAKDTVSERASILERVWRMDTLNLTVD